MDTRVGFHIVAKPNGSVCNLNCAYCFFLTKERLYPGGLFVMGDDILGACLGQSVEAQQGHALSFVWSGGEPTMIGLNFFHRAAEHQRQYLKPGSNFINEFMTNGTLLDDAWCDFFHANRFQVGISIDGPRALHDAYRKDKQDQPTFDEVIRGLDLLRKHNVDYHILCSVHAANGDYPLEIYRFFRDELEAKSIHLAPIVERDNNTGFQEGANVTARSVDARQFGEFLIAIFDEWLKYDTGEVTISTFQAALANWVGLPSGNCLFSKVCGNSPALEHNGDLYCCEHFVEPDYFLGNIKETHIVDLMNSRRQLAFGQRKLGMLPRHCRECEVLFACHGECPKNRFTESPHGEPGLNYLCAGYRAFFKHVHWPGSIMTELLSRTR